MNKRHRRPEEPERFAERNGKPVTVGVLAKAIIKSLKKRRPE